MWDYKNQIRQEQELELNLFSFNNMCSNVLPSAPPDETHGMYPQLPQHDFRMQKANEVSASLNAEIAHCRTVAKNINVPKRQSTGAQRAAVCFQLYFHLPVLPPLCQ